MEGKPVRNMEDFAYKLTEILEILRQERKIYKNYVSHGIINAGSLLTQLVKGLKGNAGDVEDVKDAVINVCREELPYESPYMAVYWYSVILKMKKAPAVFLEFVRYIRENKKEFSKNTLDFLYYQLSYMYDANPSLYDSRTKLELWKFYLEIVEEFAAEVKVSLEEIPEQERDTGLVLVIMIQCVMEGHAPTITALDRCRILQEKMGKKVLVINTGEAGNLVGRILLMDTMEGHNESLEEEFVIHWKDASIPYYQCRQGMPDMDVINQLLLEVRKLAPQRVVLVSGTSILGNLIDRMIPALTISTGFSDFAITGTRYQAIGRKLTEEDEETLKCLGYDKSHVIESTFTFDIKPQRETVTRQELGIPKDAFVMAVISTRMNEEISKEFLQMLENTLKENLYVVFVGEFSTYNEQMALLPELKENSMALGSCDDVLSRLELCDLYINPRRKGGGSSAVEAMYMGLPVVSIAYGDVAINAGEEFCVENYEEMTEKILKYYTNEEYYVKMAKKAEERAEVLLDTENAFREIMEEYSRREE